MQSLFSGFCLNKTLQLKRRVFREAFADWSNLESKSLTSESEVQIQLLNGAKQLTVRKCHSVWTAKGQRRSGDLVQITRVNSILLNTNLPNSRRFAVYRLVINNH